MERNIQIVDWRIAQIYFVFQEKLFCKSGRKRKRQQFFLIIITKKFKIRKVRIEEGAPKRREATDNEAIERPIDPNLGRGAPRKRKATDNEAIERPIDPNWGKRAKQKTKITKLIIIWYI